MSDETIPPVAPAAVAPQPPKKPKREKKAKAPKAPKPAAYPPQFEGLEPPKSMFTNRWFGKADVEYYPGCKVTGHLHMAGFGNPTADLLFVGTCPDKDECVPRFNSKPSLMQGAAANLFLRSLRRMGIADTEWYYTNLVKYWLPNGRPKPMDVRWCEAALRDEVDAIKPKLIVCLGKPAFDFFYKKKFALRDVQGGLFECPEFNCLLYPMDARSTPLLKPEFLDRVLTDMREIKQVLQETKGFPRVKLETDYHVINTAEHLDNFLREELEKKPRMIVTDCEWAGQTFVDGSLRSVQFSLRPGHAVYVRLMDEHMKYAFDQPLSVVREIVGGQLNASPVKLAGHNLAADLVWLHNHLGVETEGKAGFDTMFAIHTINEYADLKLERNAIKYCDVGRYDIPLTLWKKSSGFDDEDNEGYGTVPDRLLIRYAQADADVTMRMIPILMRQLLDAKVWTYYHNLVLPFVTDGFVEMMECGLPMDVEHLEEMRETYSRNRDILTGEFRQALTKEASMKLFARLLAIDPEQGKDLALDLMNLVREATVDGAVDQSSKAYQQAVAQLIQFAGPQQLPDIMPVFEHFVEAPQFNINSTHHISRWLYQVRKLQPFKSTKFEGCQMAWEKILTLSKEKQARFKPAADKATLKLFASKDRLVADLEGVKLVGNVVKAFLREKDPVTKREQGVFKWIQNDGSIHSNFALTETARPRTWRPNILNWPKHISRQVESAFKRVNEGYVKRYLDDLVSKGASESVRDMEEKRMSRKAVSLRSCVKAPKGHCLIDMDLRTAEVVALARLSGDRQMIGVLTEPDTQFGRISADNPKEILRVCFNSNEGIPESSWDPSMLTSPDDPRFLRDREGKIISPRRDLHAEMGCSVFGVPREKMEEDLLRGTGKIGNFCIAEGELVMTSRGLIPIESVLLEDALWDGEEWVYHDGVVFNGEKTVNLYSGLWATDQHEVWTVEAEKTTFGRARIQGLELRRYSFEGVEIESESFCGVSSYCGEIKAFELSRSGSMQALRENCISPSGQTGEESRSKVCLQSSSKLHGSEIVSFKRQIHIHDSESKEGGREEQEVLQRQRNQSSFQVFSGICHLGTGDMARERLQRTDVRPNRQQRTLLKRDSEVSEQLGEYAQQIEHEAREYGNCETVSGGASRDKIYGRGNCKSHEAWIKGGSVGGALSKSERCRTEKEEPKGNSPQVEPPSRVVKVYDILNAGPRHRYVCSGVLVSNSIPYGATGPLLERMVEVNVGKKPPEGTGEKMITAYKTRYPVASAFLDAMAETPDSPGWYRSISGRVRHFYYTEVMDLDGLSEYQRDGIKSPLTRQAKNFPMQEIVSATTARALLMFIKKRKELGLTSRIGMLLYDAVMAIAPLEQAKATADLLKHCLTDWNTWTCHLDTWHFDVDTSIGFNWGVKPTKEEKEILSKYL